MEQHRLEESFRQDASEGAKATTSAWRTRGPGTLTPTVAFPYYTAGTHSLAVEMGNANSQMLESIVQGSNCEFCVSSIRSDAVH